MILKTKTKKQKHDHEEEEQDLSEDNALIKLATSGMSDEDFLKANAIYYIFGEIKAGSLKSIHQSILVKHFVGPTHFKGDITFIINSNGGDVEETNSLLDLIQNQRCDIKTVGLGMCASAAAILLAAGTKGKRLIGASATVMIHTYSWGAYGKHQELVAHRTVQDDLYEQELQFWMKHSKYNNKRDVEKFLLRKEDTWLSAKEALKHGIVDAIGDVLR